MADPFGQFELPGFIAAGGPDMWLGNDCRLAHLMLNSITNTYYLSYYAV